MLIISHSLLTQSVVIREDSRVTRSESPIMPGMVPATVLNEGMCPYKPVTDAQRPGVDSRARDDRNLAVVAGYIPRPAVDGWFMRKAVLGDVLRRSCFFASRQSWASGCVLLPARRAACGSCPLAVLSNSTRYKGPPYDDGVL